MPARTRFISRQSELALLERGFGQACRGLPTVVLIQGEPGIGKTRLLSEFREKVARRGAFCGYGRAQQDVAPPYLLIADALMPLFEASERDRSGLLARFSASGDADALPVGNVGARSQLFFETAQALFEVGHSRPTVLIVDDLQWADPPSLELLTYLAFSLAQEVQTDESRRDALQRPALMLVGAYRPPKPDSPLDRTVARLSREPSCEHVDVAPLDAEDTRAMLEGLGFQRPANQLVQVLFDATRGNPLFMEEVVRHLERAGELHRGAGFVTTATQPEDLGLPGDIAVAIRSRTAGLSDGCRKVLSYAAVLGERFDADALCQLVGTDATQEEVDVWLEEALGERLIDEHDAQLEFSHITTRQVFYRELSRFRRERLHLDVADHLSRSRPTAVAAIAHHLVRAGRRADLERVAELTRAAADRAMAAADWGAAARFYEQCIAARADSPDPSQRELALLHFLAGLAFNHNMDPGPCIEHYDAAAEASDVAGDPAIRARALMERLRAEITYGRVARGALPSVEALRETLEQLDESQGSLRGLGLDILASAYWAARRPERAFELANEALQIGRDVGDDHLCAEVASSLALAHLERLELIEALEAWRAGVEHAERIDDLPTAGLCLQRIPLVLVYLGRLEEAQVAIDRARALNEKISNWGDFSLVTTAEAALAAIRGDFDGVESSARETLRMIARSRYPWAAPVALPTLASARSARGAFQEARDALDILIEPGHIFDDPRPMQVIDRQLRPLIDARESQLAPEPFLAERRVIDPAQLDMWRVTRVCAQVELAQRLSVPELAEGAVAALEHALGRGVVFTSGWLFLVPRCIGVALGLMGRLDDGIEQLHQAAVVAESAGAKSELARVHLDQAELLATRGEAGDVEAASALREKGEALCRELGMWPFLSEAEREDPESTTLLDGESQLLDEIARGRAQSDVASDLLLSDASVARRADRVYSKLEVDGPTGAAAAAIAIPDRPPPSVEAVMPDTAHESRPLTFMVSDMKDSTAMLRALGDQGGRELIRIHNQIVRRCLYENNGCEIQHTGDGFLTYFQAADDAVACAIALQQSFAAHNRASPSQAIKIRIGLHSGRAMPDEGRFVGIAVNLAARVCAQAAAGEILASDAVRDELSGTVKLEPRGLRELKGLETPTNLSAVIA